MMKCLLFPLSLLFLLQACSDKSHNSNPEEVVAGWRSAGITWPDAVDSGGVFELALVNDHLIALDAHATAANVDGIRYKKWRLWKTVTGSEPWTRISFPSDSCYPEEIHAYGDLLYVGSFCGNNSDSIINQYEGLWSYSPINDEWIHLQKPGVSWMPDTVGMVVGAIGNYNNEIVVSAWSSKKVGCWMGGVKDKVGKAIPCPGKKNSIWRMEFQELNGKLYAMSSDNGIFRYTEGAASWDSLSSPRGRDSYEIESVTSITAHDGHLIVGYEHNYGYNSGVYRLEKDDSWTLLTPKYMHQDSVALSDAMESTDALLSYRGWLIAGGSRQSYPRFWVPLDSARPQFGDWRIAFDNWTDLAGNYESYPRTYDLLGVGDTLYAAARTMVLKIPLAEIPEIWGYKYNAGMYPHLRDSLSRMGK